MPALSTVAGLARNNHMPALLLLIDDVGMACLTRIAARKGNRPSGDLRDRSTPIVPVLAKTPRNNSRTQDDEGNHAYHHDSSEADEVFYVLKQFLFPVPVFGSCLRANLRSDLGYIALLGETMIEVTGLCDEAHPVRGTLLF